MKETRRVEGDQVIYDRTFEMEKPLSFIKFDFIACKNEDEHDFDSTGRCRKCGSHRRPA